MIDLVEELRKSNSKLQIELEDKCIKSSNYDYGDKYDISVIFIHDKGSIEFGVDFPTRRENLGYDDKKFENLSYQQKKEKIIDEKLLNETQRKNKKVVKNSLAGVTMSDVLIMYNWLSYAKTVGDNSYKLIIKDILKSTYMENELSQQLEMRNKEFLLRH